jgi:sugar lactone lactonase YvrE
MYWGDRDAGVIKKRIGNRVTQHAKLPKGDLRWMTATPDGTLFFISTGDLYRVAPNGTVTTLAKGLGSRTFLSAGKIDRHSVMGLWTDRAGNVYAADSARSRIVRVTPKGAMNVVDTGKLTWSPSGGTFAPDGSMWILEYRATETRIRNAGVPPAGRAPSGAP